MHFVVGAAKAVAPSAPIKAGVILCRVSWAAYSGEKKDLFFVISVSISGSKRKCASSTQIPYFQAFSLSLTLGVRFNFGRKSSKSFRVKVLHLDICVSSSLLCLKHIPNSFSVSDSVFVFFSCPP